MDYLDTKSGYRLAYNAVQGKGPTVIWCGGLKSDMEGSKALHLQNWAEQTGHAYIRFDYFGHGESGGEFTQGTISRWSDDILQIIDALVDGPVILVGSSMGGWVSLLAAIARPETVKSLILINPAPDFTEKLILPEWSAAQRAAMDKDGVVYVPSDYGEPYAYSKALMDDGRKRQILDAPIPFDGSVRILQGMDDSVVPWQYSRKIMDVISSPDARYTLVKDGDHSLSRELDLALLTLTLNDIITDA